MRSIVIKIAGIAVLCIGAIGAVLAADAASGGSAGAVPAPADASGNAVANAPAGAAELVKRLKALRPDIPIKHVSATPVDGIYALEMSGGTVYYGTADGRYLFAGDLYRLGDDDLVNVTETGRAEMRKKLLAAVPRKDMVIFSPKGATKAVIDVFTDVDCPYCQKLHQEVPELNRMGVEVRYLAYPRAGIGSKSYDKMVSAWCSPDPNTAITRLKAHQSVPEAHCKNPVAAEYELGRRVGVTGTPSIVLEDGRMLPGYLPAKELAKAVGL